MIQSTKDINSLEDLQTYIKLTKARVKEAEADLELRWNRLPQETIKATLGSIVPLFLNNTVAGGTWGILKTAFGFFLNKKQNEENWKEGVVEPAKQLSILAIFNLIKGFFKK